MGGTWVHSYAATAAAAGDAGGNSELNALQTGKSKGKGKGKGGDGGKSGKCGGKSGSPRKPPPGGCFICKGKHWASECPHNALRKGQPSQAGHNRALEEVRLGCLEQITNTTTNMDSQSDH